MDISRIDASKKEIFNAFVAENGGSFLQSFEWGEFQEKTGKKIRRLVMEDGGKILAAMTLVLHPLPFKKNYLYCGRGPIFGNAVSGETAFPRFLEEIKKIAAKENAIFFKIEPPKNFPPSPGHLAEFGFKKSLKEIQPSETVILDLRKNEEELLKEMKQKTRYNIRLAEKHEIKIKESNDFEGFWKLLEKTARRDKFHLHLKNYYETMLRGNGVATATALPSGGFSNKLFFAEKGGEIIAGTVVNFFGKRAAYLHGASSAEHKNLMAPYLLHWEIVRYAKKNGFEEYDFWGISKKKYPGVTRFKLGFGGTEIKYSGAFDLTFDKFWRLVYSIGRRLL